MKKLILCLSIIFFGCGSNHNPSDTEIVNGVESVSYPAIVDLSLHKRDRSIGLCTGTFIQTDLILTAAHCVDNVINVEVFGYQASKIIKDKYHEYTFDGLSHDFALIKFDKPISIHTMRIAIDELKDRDEITLIGYGVNTYFPYRSGAGIKRIGFNTYYLNNYLERGIIQFEGYQRSIGDNGSYIFSSVGQGDSGGPLIKDGEIVGIASAQALYNDINSSYYAYTVSDQFKDFIFRALKVL